MPIKTVELHDKRTSRTISLRVVDNGVAHTRPEPVDRGKPKWLRATLPTGPNYERLRSMTRELGLYTVCQEAHCPNIGECWSHGTMTIMVLGGVCTRACKFCAVDTGNPQGWVDIDEPRHVGIAIAQLGLNYVVMTSVDRDDLPDGGAAHFAQCVREIKQRDPRVKVETLSPDFQGDLGAVETVLASGVDVFAHNIETVRRLTPTVRDPRATYQQTLAVLEHAKKHRSDVLTKSSIMLGLGETEEEIRETMADLRAVHVDIFTLGQYLRPTQHHLPVQRYVPPEDFEKYRQWGIEAGFLEVFSGPMVRSSYRAEKVFLEGTAKRQDG
ncbi:MAG TPA: lipoyl synthase [Gemmatales bacterium]|nr:lipoyl synthase [Gemmatales bacterium]